MKTIKGNSQTLFMLCMVVSIVAMITKRVLVDRGNIGVFYYISCFFVPTIYYLIAFREGQREVTIWTIMYLLVGSWLVFTTWIIFSAPMRGIIAFISMAIPFFIGQRISQKPKNIEKAK